MTAGNSNGDGSTLSLQQLLHFKKADIGVTSDHSQSRATSVPLQIALPTGGFGLGVSVARHVEQANQNRDAAVILSAPDHDQLAVEDKRYIQICFIIFAIFNLIVTTLMYRYTTTADPSSVNDYRNRPNVLHQPASERSYIENANFALFVVVLFVGILSTLFESALGLSAYALALALNFLLGSASLPYYLYSFRYLIDFVLFYLALVLRSRITYTFLPTKIFDIRDRIRL